MTSKQPDERLRIHAAERLALALCRGALHNVVNNDYEVDELRSLLHRTSLAFLSNAADVDPDLPDIDWEQILSRACIQMIKGLESKLPSDAPQRR